MGFAAVLIDTLHAAFKNAEIAFNRIAVDRWNYIIDILIGAVVRRAMRCKMLRQPDCAQRHRQCATNDGRLWLFDGLPDGTPDARRMGLGHRWRLD